MIEWLLFPFMQRAILAGVILGALLALLGVFVVLKRMSFMSDGLAHASLAGIAAGLLLKTDPLYAALGFSAGAAALVAWLEQRTKLASDAIIGLLFTTGMAAGVVMLAWRPGYQPDLVSFLFGNILSIRWQEIGLMAIVASAVLTFVFWKYRQLALLILNPDLARVNGIPVNRYRTLLYVIIALATVLGMKLLGIVLVSALLILPVSTAKLVATSFRNLMVWSVVFSEAAVLLGIVLSIVLDLPTGAVTVLCGTAIFALVFILNRLKK